MWGHYIMWDERGWRTVVMRDISSSRPATPTNTSMSATCRFYAQCVSIHKKSGNEIHYTVFQKMLVKLMMSCKLRRQKLVKLKHISYQMTLKNRKSCELFRTKYKACSPCWDIIWITSQHHIPTWCFLTFLHGGVSWYQTINLETSSASKSLWRGIKLWLYHVRKIHPPARRRLCIDGRFWIRPTARLNFSTNKGFLPCLSCGRITRPTGSWPGLRAHNLSGYLAWGLITWA